MRLTGPHTKYASMCVARQDSMGLANLMSEKIRESGCVPWGKFLLNLNA